MASQRERGRSAQRFADATTSPDVLETRGASRFLGDHALEGEAEGLGLLSARRETRGPVREGAVVDVITAETPFYAESGGQVGDRGWLTTASGTRVEIVDTHRIAPPPIGHRGGVR